jgi:hypothetical protein
VIAKEAIGLIWRTEDDFAVQSVVANEHLGHLDQAQRDEEQGHRIMTELEERAVLWVVVEQDGDDDPTQRIEQTPTNVYHDKVSGN